MRYCATASAATLKLTRCTDGCYHSSNVFTADYNSSGLLSAFAFCVECCPPLRTCCSFCDSPFSAKNVVPGNVLVVTSGCERDRRRPWSVFDAKTVGDNNKCIVVCHPTVCIIKVYLVPGTSITRAVGKRELMANSSSGGETSQLLYCTVSRPS